MFSCGNFTASTWVLQVFLVLNCTCDYKIANKHHLTEHLRTHTGDKPYSCNCCDFKCSCRYTLTLHIRTHTGDKPFPCDVCGKSFAQSSHLKDHLRTHTGEKDHKCHLCDQCGKLFGKNTSAYTQV